MIVARPHALWGAPLALLAVLGSGCGAEVPEPPPPTPGCATLPEGAPCDDNSACTQRDVCRAGVCSGEDPVTCQLGDCDASATCDPATGACRRTPVDDGTACDDADACSEGTTCSAGRCVGGAPTSCAPSGPCVNATCDPAQGCVQMPKPDGEGCDDTDACTEQTTCSAGVCGGGTPLVCTSSIACNTARCDADQGCVLVPVADNLPCEDGDACTDDSVCTAGQCGGGIGRTCTSTSPCERAFCDASGGCVVEPLADDAPCDDGDACTEDTVCRAGLCAGTPVVCEASDGCHLVVGCEPSVGCTEQNAPNGTTCDDGVACTQGSFCVNGTCGGGSPRVCTSTIACKVGGACEPGVGCPALINAAEFSACDDQDSCTFGDRCVAGACAPERTLTCDALPDQCHVGVCDPVNERCSYVFDPFDGQRCEDGICFTDVTSAVGITWQSTTNLIEYMAAGGAFLDYDGDGWLDILLISETTAPALYRNDGSGASFTDVTQAAGLVLPPGPPAQRPILGATTGDYDNDGDTDIYLLVMGHTSPQGPNLLYRNEGNGTFTEVGALAGVDDPLFSVDGAFGDFDGDGDLDLFVGNYIEVNRYPNHTGFPNRLYLNQGDGTFVDITQSAGVGGIGTTLAVTWTDLEGDGDLDLIVCNDFGSTVQANQIFVQDVSPDGLQREFTELAQTLGADIQFFCMSIAPGDYDRDGDLDYYYSNLGLNAFLSRTPTGYTNVTAATGTGLEADECDSTLLTTSWASAQVDFDRDGWLDLWVSNGHVPAAVEIANSMDSTKSVFKHLGPSLTYRNVSGSAGVLDRRIGRGAAFGDYDGDGDVDVLQFVIDGAPLLYRNDSPPAGGFLTVGLTGRISNRDGAHTRVTAELPGVSLLREVNPNSGYVSSSEKAVHFGLGAATDVPRLVARWTSGVRQRLVHVPANMRVELTEPLVYVATATAPPMVFREGQPVGVTLDLTNASAQIVSVTVQPSLRVGAQAPSDGTPSSVQVTPQQTLQTGFVMTVPIGASGGQVTPAELLVTVSDAGGGVDQVALPIQIAP